MPAISFFLDSSALISGIISSEGAARALLLLAEDDKLTLIICEQIIAEVERNLARKIPRVLPYAREMIRLANIRIRPNPKPEEWMPFQDWITHQADLPILFSAYQAQVDYLVTLNRRHFLEDPGVGQKSGLRIGTPGDALAWAREHLRPEHR